MLRGHEPILQVLILLLDGGFLPLELLHFLPLSLAARLSCCPVPQDSLDPSLLLLIFGLGSLSDQMVSRR